MDDYIDPYQDPNENVPFCKEDSLICSKVSDINNKPIPRYFLVTIKTFF